MHDNLLVAISLCVAGIGITILMIASFMADEGSMDILKGTIITQTHNKARTVMQLEHTCMTTIFIESNVTMKGCAVVIGKRSGDMMQAASLRECVEEDK